MAETEFKYDVFISYSHKDEAWADKVLRQRLDDAGFKVCIDYRDFEAGKMALLNMQDASMQSKHVVLVLTRNWLNSEWSLFEASMGGTEDPAGLQKKLIPLLCEDGIQKDINPFIAMRTWVDFTRKDREAIAWKQLFTALGKPDAPIPTDKTPTPATGSRDTWNLKHPYPMPPNFTGRAKELQMLDDWLADDQDRLLVLRALGGFGKSALAWQWINTHVNPAEWTKLVWWSFYEGDASFEHFAEETLKYLNHAVPQSKREQVDELLKVMQSQKVLLFMDGFERALRAYGSMNAAYQGDEEPKLDDNQYDCVDLNAETFLKSLCALPGMKSKVLITTRLTPRAVNLRGECLQGCHEKELQEMDKADAVAFFHAQGIKGMHSEIEAACEPYGYHPLSLRILAGFITNDRENPNDINVAEKLDITDDLIQNKNHVLKVAYDALSFGQQKLLSNIACLRSPTSYLSAINTS